MMSIIIRRRAERKFRIVLGLVPLLDARFVVGYVMVHMAVIQICSSQVFIRMPRASFRARPLCRSA